ncbi:MAG: hypothetical protein N2039_11030, partial [Gemmataceae bacterium]|nr:hypothetical protein [Gemmataceae bacterium]
MPPRIAAIWCGVLLLLAGARSSPALAQAQPTSFPAERGFIRSRSFQMPFNLPPGDVTKVQSVKLYVRPANSRDWQLHATASPAQTRYDPASRQQVGSFDVRLDQDGAYEFAIMTVFTDGASDPPGVDALRPEQTVTVDTVPPDIVLKPMPSRKTADGSLIVGYEWRVTDEFLAKNTVRVEGRWYDVPTWHTIDTEPEGRREWTIPAQRPMEVRVVAADKAGNMGSRVILLGRSSGGVAGQPTRSGGDGPNLPQTNFRLVNSQTIQLRYRIHERPPSGLDRLELWVTRLGNKWERVEQDFKVPDDSSETAELPYQATQDGTYGFTIIAYSKAGIASRPAPKNNDPPQLWVEVDTKPPTANLKTVRLARPDDSRTLLLEWTAEDKNIEALPIIFEYAELDSAGNASPNWKELTPPLPNNGRYVCATPQLPPSAYQFRVRMHVFDRAGNVATIEHPTPISVDVMKPQVEIFDVNSTRSPTGSAPAERGPSMSPPGGSSPAPSLPPPGGPSPAPSLPPPGGDLLSQPPGLP